MEIAEIVEQFKNEYSKLISDFSIADDIDPMTPAKLQHLSTVLNDWYNALQICFSHNNDYTQEFKKHNLDMQNDYLSKIRNLNASLNKTIQDITNLHIENCKKIDVKLEASKQKTRYAIEQLELDYNYFCLTSDQNKLILVRDFNEAKKRFDYQKEEAKESYLQIVKKNNSILEEIKRNLYTKNLEAIANYEQDTHGIITKLNATIDEKNHELNKVIQALENEKNNMKEKYRQESANLNETIKKISAEKNNVIDNARGIYNKSISDANIEKENNKSIYQSEAQSLLKEFVTKISKIDETTTSLNKAYETCTDNLKREFYTTSFATKQKTHREIEQIYETGLIDKQTKKIISQKNKQLLAEYKDLKEDCTAKLVDLAKDNIIQLYANKNNKNFLEIDKNYAIKNITDKEQYDNKYFQQKDNVYENNFNFTVKTANINFSQKANLLRCQSQIRTKLLERNYDGIEANYYKKIELMQNKINALHLEIELSEKLRKIVRDYQENKYQNQLHLEEVTNLLNIEKNKLLKIYNLSLYDHNLRNITLAKEYGFKKIDLENQMAFEIKNLNAKYEDYLFQKINASAAFDKKREELEKKYGKVKAQDISSNRIKRAKERYLFNLKNNDVFYIKQITSSFNNFYDIYLHHYRLVLNNILSDMNDDASYHYLNAFFSSFFKIFVNLYNNILNCFYNIVEDVLNKRIDYIYKFKYKSSIDASKDDYLSKQASMKEQKSAILDKIDSSSKTIENFKQKIYVLINDNEMLIQNEKYKYRKLRVNILNQVKKTELKIKEYREKIEDYNKMISLYMDDLDLINIRLDKNVVEYEIENKKINKMLEKDTILYLKLKRNIFEYISTQKKKLTNLLLNKTLAAKNRKQLLNKMIISEKKMSSLILAAKIEVENIHIKFGKANSKEQAQMEMSCAIEAKKSQNSFNKDYTKALKEFDNELNDALSIHISNIANQQNVIEKTNMHFEELLRNAKDNFIADSNDNMHLHYQEIKNFYLSSYALDANNEKIIAYHRQSEDKNLADFKSAKQKCIKDIQTKKNKNNDKLRSFLKTKDEEISHLPIAFKYNSLLLNNETKKKNTNLHDELKNAKNDFNFKRKQIDKEIIELKNQLVQSKNENEFKQKQSISLEKKNYKSSLKHALNSIKINL